MHNLSRILLAALLGWGIVQGARAAEKLALVIGNSAYAEAPLRNPRNDVKGMSEALDKLGFEVITVQDGNKREMVDALRRFEQGLQRGGVGLFYYSGHGVQDKGRNYLIPVGANIGSAADLEFEALDAQQVLSHMEQAGSGLNVVILDACRNSPFRGWTRSLPRGLARLDGIQGSLIAYSTQPGNVAEDGAGEYSPYTGALLAHLSQAGLTLPELFNTVGLAVSEATSGQQQPWFASSPLKPFCFAGCGRRDNIGQEITVAGRTYIAYDDGTALDTATGLMWMRCSLGQTWDGKTCQGEAKEFTWENAKKQTANFAGYSDWELPSIEELRTLVYCSNGQPAYFNNGKPGGEEYAAAQGKPDNFDWGCRGESDKDHERPSIAQAVFPNTPDMLGGFVWSSSAYAGDSYGAWGVFFECGHDYGTSRPANPHVRLMRNGQ